MRDDLEIGLLRSFVAVARSGSFTRAAHRLCRVQSAVSNQIKRLEAIVGVRLFDRSGRTVTLTREGEQLLVHARRLITLNEQALADLGRDGAVSGRLRLAVTDTSALYLPPVLRRFAEAFPLARFEVQCCRSWEALEALESGDTDLALVTQPCGRDGGTVVRRESLRWVEARGSLAAEQDPLPIAIFADGCMYRSAILAALDTSGRRWRLAYDSPSRDVLQMAVESRLAITVLPQSLIGPGLRIVDPAHRLPPLPEMEILMFRNDAAHTRALDTLADVIAEVLTDPLADPLAAVA